VADVVDRALICDSGDCIDPLCRMSRALRTALQSQGYSREWRTPSNTSSPPPMLIPIWYDWPTDDDREAGMCDDPDAMWLSGSQSQPIGKLLHLLAPVESRLADIRRGDFFRLGEDVYVAWFDAERAANLDEPDRVRVLVSKGRPMRD
jgi:hypothetical protein